jgi:predicted transcriptional regulator of viral defense system
MAKVDILQLRKILDREEFDHVLLASALAPYSAVDQKINELIKSGVIVRVKKGLYVFGPKVRQVGICKESLANLIYGPSYISMEYALAYHGLIPERVETITSVTSMRDKKFDTPIGSFTYRYLGRKKYPHEIEQLWVDRQHPILIATPEKALFDYVTLNDVPNLVTPKAAMDFLRADLRIDDEGLKRFALRNLLRLNKYYKSRNMALIMEAL